MIKLLHFADAHIDIANHGRHDPQSGLTVRSLDFLKALDTIIDAAIDEHVDLVLFAGDAYRDRTPVPTFQREWGKRIQRLSQAEIQTLLLVGNHDLSPAIGRAHALQEFDTLQVPYVRVLDKPQFLTPQDLQNLPVQMIAIPWVSRSRLMAALELTGSQSTEVYAEIEARLTVLIHTWLENADPDLPIILTAHASVQGAKYGAERSVMLGNDIVLPGSLVRDARLDYVALGHIHKAQDLNEGARPAVIYPGSIERVDFGEAQDDKFFVIAEIDEVKRDRPSVNWIKLEGRKFIDCSLQITSPGDIFRQMVKALPSQEEFTDAIVRFTLEYPREYDPMIDDAALRLYMTSAFEFYFVRRPRLDARIRLPGDERISSLTPMELLEKYWDVVNIQRDDLDDLNKLAQEIISGAGLE
ncbi:MAG: exonuclease SbcCD subunit D [Anaerolineaceae bacterium]|nr:exonuclease SbcCD subunit D [Anaerolineaceae bacterium]